MTIHRSIGSLAQLACEWEVRARKAGNVCPGREFPDLTVADFLKSAAAIAPVLEQASRQPLGITILRCIEATRQVVNTNTNLGIVLLLAPLASVPLEQPLQPSLSQILAATTVEDARNVFAAIRLAKPGGLGKASDQDIHDEPTLPLREVMALAQDRDLIAAQYATDFDIATAFVDGLQAGIKKHGNVEIAIIEMQLYLLGRNGDDLIRRKLGDRAGAYRLPALKILEVGLDTPAGRQAFLDFDNLLRADNHNLNPGTTADMLAAILFVALRERRIAPETPFTWHEHPFQENLFANASGSDAYNHPS